MGTAKDKAAVLNLLTGETVEPDYPNKMAYFKAALVGYATSIKRGEPKDELRRVCIEKMAEMDKLFVHGGGDIVSRFIDAHTIKVLVNYHAIMLAYLTVQNMSDEGARTMARDIAETKAQTAPCEQVKNNKHAIRLDRAERDKGKKNPGGQRKPGGLQKLKVVMQAIQTRRDARVKASQKPYGVLAISEELVAEKDLPWSAVYLKNQFSRWDGKKGDFRKQTAHGS